MIRSITGQLSTVSTRMICGTPGPSRKLMMTMPARIAGTPIAMSVMRAITLSKIPPKKPANEPSVTPMTPASRGTISPTVSDTRAP